VLFSKAQDTLKQYPIAKHGDAYTIPNGVMVIGADAFCKTRLTSVAIPNSVKTIRDGAFGESGLTSVTIPRSVEYIGNVAFSDCYQLNSVTCLNRVPPIVENDDAFDFCEARPVTATLYVPAGSANAYKRAPGWRILKNILWK
jgi:hypothetical protein